MSYKQVDTIDVVRILLKKDREMALLQEKLEELEDAGVSVYFTNKLDLFEYALDLLGVPAHDVVEDEYGMSYAPPDGYNRDGWFELWEDMQYDIEGFIVRAREIMEDEKREDKGPSAK